MAATARWPTNSADHILYRRLSKVKVSVDLTIIFLCMKKHGADVLIDLYYIHNDLVNI